MVIALCPSFLKIALNMVYIQTYKLLIILARISGRVELLHTHCKCMSYITKLNDQSSMMIISGLSNLVGNTKNSSPYSSKHYHCSGQEHVRLSAMHRPSMG